MIKIARLTIALAILSPYPLSFGQTIQTTAPHSAAQSTSSLVQDDSHSGTFLLTIFLKHDQSKPLPAIDAELKQNGFFRDFPPQGSEIVSWYVVMGIGQIVTLRVQAEKLRDVNRVIENSAWGGFRTEFYPTYDFRKAWEEQRKQMNEH